MATTRWFLASASATPLQKPVALGRARVAVDQHDRRALAGFEIVNLHAVRGREGAVLAARRAALAGVQQPAPPPGQPTT